MCSDTRPLMPIGQRGLVVRRRAQLPNFLEIRARDIGMNSPGGAAQHRARGNTLCGAIRLVGRQRVGDLASALPAQPRARRCRGWTHAQRWSTGHLRRTTEWTVEGGVLKMGREHSDWTVLISPGHWVTIEMTQTQRSGNDDARSDSHESESQREDQADG